MSSRDWYNRRVFVRIPRRGRVARVGEAVGGRAHDHAPYDVRVIPGRIPPGEQPFFPCSLSQWIDAGLGHCGLSRRSGRRAG